MKTANKKILSQQNFTEINYGNENRKKLRVAGWLNAYLMFCLHSSIKPGS
jgi:hypothetical protein